MSKKWALTNVSIRNFKSIAALDFHVQQGFTILTGPNGSGKSNILEAITFGLGEVPQRLRVSKLEELGGEVGSIDRCGDGGGRGRKGQKTVVDLTFHCNKERITTVIRSSIVDKQRVYYIASKKVTKRIFERYIRSTLGFSRERSCFNIKQNAAQQLIKASPKQLFSFLCDAAGTQNVLAARDEAKMQISQAHNSLSQVLTTIQDFKMEVEKDEKLRDMFLQLKKSKSKLHQLSTDIRKSHYLSKLSHLFGVLIALQENIQKDSQEHAIKQALKEELLEATKQLSASTSAVTKCECDLQIYQDLKNVLDDNVIQIRHFHKLLSSTEEKKKQNARQHEVLNHSIAKIEDRMNLVKQKIVELQNNEFPQINRDMCYWEEQLKRQSLGNENSECNFNDRDGLQRQKIKLQSSLQHQECEIMSLTSRCLELAAEESAQKMAIQHLESCVETTRKKVVDKSKELNQTLDLLIQNNVHEDEYNIDAEAVVGCRDDHIFASENRLKLAQKAQLDMQSRLDIAKEHRSHFRRNKLKLPLDADIGTFGINDYGCLADVLVLSLPLKRPDDVSNSYVEYENLLLQGLQQVLGPNLGVRLCGSQNEAISIMHQYEHLSSSFSSSISSSSSSNGATMRIWPLDVLHVACHRPAVYSSLLSPYPVSPRSCFWQAVDPAACFSVTTTKICTSSKPAPFYQRALYKACHMWILTANDDIAKDVMNRLVTAEDEDLKNKGRRGIGCITASGNRHTIGGMIITNNKRISIDDDTNSRNKNKKQFNTNQSRCETRVQLPQPPVAHLNDYHELNLKINSYHEQLDMLKVVVNRRSQAHDLLIQLFQNKQQLEELRAEISSASLSYETVQQELEIKTKERDQKQGVLLCLSEQLDDVTSILNFFDQPKHSAVIMASSYADKQLKFCQRSLHALESRRCQLGQEQSELVVRMEDAKSELQELLQEEQDIELNLQKYIKQVATLRSCLDETEQKISDLCVTHIEEQMKIKLELRERLQARVDMLVDSIAESEATMDHIKEDGVCFAHDYKANVLMLDTDNEIDLDGDMSDISDARRAQRMKVKLTVKQECDLINVQTISSLQSSVLLEICEFFQDGHALAQHLKDNCHSFQMSLTLDLQELIVSREKQKDQWQTLHQDFVFIQQQYKNPLRNYKLLNKTKTKKGFQPTARKSSRTQCAVSNEPHNETVSEEKFDLLSNNSNSYYDLNLEVYEVQMEQRKCLLENLESKFQQITMGISILNEGLERLHQQLKRTHWQVYEKIRQRFADYFDDLVQIKDTKCDLIPVTFTTTSPDCGVGVADELENGFKIVLTNSALRDRNLSNKCEEITSVVGEGLGEKDGDSTLGVHGLSGGQQALLGLSLLFSCALSGQRSPIYFLDEVDSSLDEANQNAIAKAVANIFMVTNEQQVICVSHNKNFQKHTTNQISVKMSGGHTTIIQ